MGLITDKTSVILDYLSTPFLATQKTRDGDEIDTLRCLGVIDHENKSCGYIGRIDEGSELKHGSHFQGGYREICQDCL